MADAAKILRNSLLVGVSAILLSGCASNRPAKTSYTGSVGAIASASPQIKAAQERHYQAQQQQNISTAAMLPEVALTASLTKHAYDDLTPTSRSGSKKFGVGLNWQLLRSVAAIKGVRAAYSNVKAADAAIRAQENDLLVEVVSTIAAYHRAAMVAALRTQRYQSLSRYLSDQKKRLSIGEVSNTDLQQIRTRIAAAQGARAQADAEKSGALALLASFGLTAERQIILAAPQAHLPTSEDKVVALARRHNPAEKESQFRIDAAEHNVDQVAMGLLPELRLGVNADRNVTDYSDSSAVTTNNVALRLDLSVPLFDGGRRRAELLAQQSKVRELRYEAQGSSTGLEVTVRRVWYRYNAALSSYKYAQSRHASAKKALLGIREARKVGARSVSDELSAMEELTEAQVSLANAEHDILVFGHQIMGHIDQVANAYKLRTSR